MLDIYLISAMTGLIGLACYVIKLKLDLKNGKYLDWEYEKKNIILGFTLSIVPIINILYAVFVGMALIHYLFLYITFRLILKE